MATLAVIAGFVCPVMGALCLLFGRGKATSAGLILIGIGVFTWAVF